MRLRSFTVAITLVLGAACGNDDESELCPEPTPAITAPADVRPDLSLVPECKRPDAQTMVAPRTP